MSERGCAMKAVPSAGWLAMIAGKRHARFAMGSQGQGKSALERQRRLLGGSAGLMTAISCRSTAAIPCDNLRVMTK